MHDQRGHPHGGEQRTNVDLEIAAHDLAGHFRRARVALETRDLGDRALIGVRDEGGAERASRSPPRFERSDERLAGFGLDTHRVVGAAREPGAGAVEREARNALRVGGGEEHRQRASFGHAEEMRVGPFARIHHGPDVVGAVGQAPEAEIPAREAVPRLSKAMTRHASERGPMRFA